MNNSENSDYDELLSQDNISSQQNAKSYFKSGLNKFRNQRYQEAINDFNEAIKLKKNYAQAYFGRATAKNKLEKYDEAIADYDQAIKLKQDYPKAYCNRGAIKAKKKLYKEAIKDYDKAIACKSASKLKSGNAKPYFNRGCIKQKNKDYPGAFNDFKEALNKRPEHFVYLFSLAQVSSKMGQKQQAIQYYQLAQKSFKSQSKQILKSKYNLSNGNLNYIARCFKEYQALIEVLQKEAEKKNISESRMKQLKNQVCKDFIELTPVEQPKLSEDKKQKNIEETYQYLLRKIQQESRKNQIRFAQQNQQIKKLQQEKENAKIENQGLMMAIINVHQNVESNNREVSGIRQQVNNQQQRTNIRFAQQDSRLNNQQQRLDSLQQQYQNMSARIYATDNVLRLIRGLDNNRLKEYYDLLYSMIINHFIAYRMISTGFFNQNTRSIGTFGSVLSGICNRIRDTPIARLIGVPFQIINFIIGQQTQQINKVIAKKINGSHFKTQERITAIIAHFIKKLIGNVEFNNELQEAITNQESEYLNNLTHWFKQQKQSLYSTVFGTTKCPYSYVQQVVLLHITLLTKRLYECEEDDFQRVSQHEENFFNFFTEAIQNSQNSIGQVVSQQIPWYDRIYQWFCS